MQFLWIWSVIALMLSTPAIAHGIIDVSMLSKQVKIQETSISQPTSILSFQTHQVTEKFSFTVACEPKVDQAICKRIITVMEQAIKQLDQILVPKNPIKILTIASNTLCESRGLSRNCDLLGFALPTDIVVVKVSDEMQLKSKFPVFHSKDSFHPVHERELIFPIALAKQMPLMDKNKKPVQNLEPQHEYDIIVKVNTRKPIWIPEKSRSKTNKYDLELILRHELLVRI